MKNLELIQNALQAAGLDGWLLYDFRGLNPIAVSIAELPAHGVFTRRWARWVPARGKPVWLVHRIEIGPFAGRNEIILTYVSWHQFRHGLQELLGHAVRIAMEYSPENAIPYVARVDAGTLELVRGLGVEVTSSADLVQLVQARWTAKQLEQHRRAAHLLNQIKDETFAWLASELRAGRAPGEMDGQQFVMQQFALHNLVTDHAPIVAFNQHSGDPHYAPNSEQQFFLQRGDFVLLDLWAKLDEPNAVFADITWTAFAGAQLLPEHERVFDIVARARDAAIAFVQTRVANKQPVHGWEVDDAARAVIAEAGFGDRFFHRTGHSIDTTTHGNGVNMDNLETHDERRLIPGIGFSVEPGIYLEQFGVRSEVNVYVADDVAEVTTQPVQTQLVALLDD